VGRRAQPEIKQRLLDACTDHALEHGLPDQLEPLAAAAGTSARMLIYHFGTRDALLRAVLAQARQRQLVTFGELLQARPNEAYAVTLERAWVTMAGPGGQPYLRMFGQLRQSTEQLLWPDFRRQATTDWLPLLEDGLRTIGRPELATLLLAVIRGLLMDLDATGDAARTDEAFRYFLDAIRTRPVPMSEDVRGIFRGPAAASRESDRELVDHSINDPF
jgi:AcrR family transcriptional regulator